MAVRVAVLEERMDKQEGSLEKIWAKLDEIQKSLNGRPTWGVATLITALVGLASALITRAVMGG